MKTTRAQIIASADQLFYQRGFDHTSFADIAKAVKISRGNFYYHFKSKDEILSAVIAARLSGTKDMLAQWEAEGATPEDRIRSFIHILIQNRTLIMQYGCPVGSLCTELAKLDHAAQPDAVALFSLFQNWLQKQFTLMGLVDDSDALAMHLLARSQGVATLANAFHDDAFVEREVHQMCDWLQSLSAANPTH